MSRTYTFNATIYGGRRAGINMMLQGFSSSDTTKVGWYKQGSTDYAGAVSMFFDSASLLDLRSKAINGNFRISSIKLTINSSDTFAYSVPVLYAAKDNSSTTDWAVRDGYDTIQCPKNGKIPELTLFTDEGGSYDWGYIVPESCAYVVGGYYRTYSYVTVTSAVLTIVTTETQKTITYNANGGTNAPSATTAWGDGAATTNITTAKPTRVGYNFVNWNTAANGSGTSYASGASITISSNITLYAQWQIITYSVSYNANGGSGAPSPQTKTYDVALTLSTTVPTRTGYSFLGWSASSTATSATYAAGGQYATNASIVLYAVWQLISYQVSYNANGGSGAPANQTKYYGQNLTLSSTIPTRTGYSFLGWGTSSTATAVAYAAGATYTANAALSLYAIWQAQKSTITSAPDGTIGSNVTVSWSSHSSAFTHRLTFTLGSYSESVDIAAGVTSKTYTLPSAWLNQLPTSISGTATVVLTTFVSGTNIGTSSATFTASVAASVLPSIGAISASKVNPHWDLYLQGYSSVTIAVSSCAAGTGASIASYQITGHALTYSVQSSATSASATSDILTSTGTLTYTVKITDTRGRTAERTISITVAAYSPPNISNITGVRCNSDGTVNPTTGTSIKTSATFTWSAVGSNQLSSVIEYKKHSASTYTTARSGISSGTLYVIAVNSAEIASSYDVRVTITDSLSNSFSYVVIVPPVTGISFGLKNDRARFGGPVEEDGLVCDWDFKLGGNLILRDSLGNSATLTYQKLVDLLRLV